MASFDIHVSYYKRAGELLLRRGNRGSVACTFNGVANKYYDASLNSSHFVAAGDSVQPKFALSKSAFWYDFSVKVEGQADFSRRLAGHRETGNSVFSDPTTKGRAIADQYRV